MKIILLDEKPMSWNLMYSGMHWNDRKDEADRVHMIVKNQLRKMGIRPQKSLFANKVNITVTGYFKGRAIDADNLASKFYIDGLKDLVISDDSPKYVDSVTTRCRVDRVSPRVEIDVEEVV